MSLRLLAGELAGRRIEVPPGVRPTESRLREALLSIWRELLPGCRFLDLFAGSGAVGLEAWSLGAARVAFVEKSGRAVATLRENCRLAPGAEIVRGSVPQVLARRPEGSFDLVFADPPYAFERYEELIAAVSARAGPDTELALEHSVRRTPAEHVAPWRCRERRRYGESSISFYRKVDRS